MIIGMIEKQVKRLLYDAKECCEQNRLLEGLEMANQAISLAPHNVHVLRRLISLHHRLGNISQRLEYLEQLKDLSGRIYEQEYDMACDEKWLQTHEWVWSDDWEKVNQGNTIVHVLNKSFPEVNGYTVRSAEIVKHQLAAGLNPVVVTKLGWPSKEQVENLVQETETYDDICHYRLYEPKMELNKVAMRAYFDRYAHHFAHLVAQLKPKVIHAASNFQNALPPLAVANQLKIPSVYEVRGMWHYSQSAKIAGFENSERYHLHEKYELICCRLADQVIAISQCLKEHLINLGVDASKVHVVPNGVNTKEFQPLPPSLEMQQKYDLEGKVVIGFIGSVTPYEGLEYVWKALARIRHKQDHIKMLVVGDGPAIPPLKQLADQLGLVNMVTFVGKVPRQQVQEFYSVIDVFPFPRIKAKVCELVPPIKPFEAMAMGKLVMVSDIPALKEIVSDETGLRFKPEDVESLLECLHRVDDSRHLGENGRKWVTENRNWNQLISRYKEIYEEMERENGKKHDEVTAS
jgi:glycosyltransferase involved in cell wall biosynthesis